MGGDTLRCFTSEDEFSLDNDYPEFQSNTLTYYRDDDDESFSGSNGFFPKEFDEVGSSRICSNPVEFDGNLRRRKIAYREIMKNYDELWVRRDSLYQAKCKILSYSPGSWINDDKRRSNYIIPKTTTLLLIGPRGSGKSSLVNRISKVFEDDKFFASERAQVTYNSSAGEGTYFLQEYMIPRGSTSFCLFDTRSLSENFADNDEMLRHWMARGVRHGELITRDSDSFSLKRALKCKAEQSGPPSSEARKVNFVIFVVNGLSVLRAMNGDKKEDRRYMDMVTETFSFPYLSFKDDKPVVVVTHGDLLSLGDRARVRVYLGEKLGVPPAKQIFDIPDNSDPSIELTIIDMIKYSLEHADKNLPRRVSKEWADRIGFSEDLVDNKVFKTSILTSVFLAILLGIVCVVFPMYRSQKHDEPIFTPTINWHAKSEVHQPYEPHERLMTFPSDSHSKSGVNQSHENQRHQSHQPGSKSGHQSRKPEPKSLPNVPDELKDSTLLSSLPDKLEEARVVPTLPDDFEEPKVVPTLPSKHVVNAPCKQAEPRFPSPERRHPKSAVKWHKTRHLWLHSD